MLDTKRFTHVLRLSTISGRTFTEEYRVGFKSSTKFRTYDWIRNIVCSRNWE